MNANIGCYLYFHQTQMLSRESYFQARAHLMQMNQLLLLTLNAEKAVTSAMVFWQLKLFSIPSMVIAVKLKQCELSTLTSEKTTVFQPSLGHRVSLLVKILVVLKLVGRSAQIFLEITTQGSSLIGLITFTPTIQHYSMATVIGLCLRVKMMRCLPPHFKERFSGH
ncbi:uncharacterized protein LOC131258042 isoform X3 [Magnolia sinica]|uniref:uncharacterized protein LOC131258042 isoform X3 n=1 Tax=Magnolia sinica TaxID=86752 RepID=UPI002657D441|nr:uncharacterized protein LOC131258042 isoform X3 [Magnolia sinica]